MQFGKQPQILVNSQLVRVMRASSMGNNLAFGPSANLLSGGSAAEKATRYRNTWMNERVHKRKYRSMAKERRK